MNSQIVLGVIAAIVALLGVVLFGRPKGRDQAEADRVEQVTAVEPTEPAPIADEPVSPSEPAPTAAELEQPAPQGSEPEPDRAMPKTGGQTSEVAPIAPAPVSPPAAPVPIHQPDPSLVSLDEVIYGEPAIQAALVNDVAVAPLDAAVLEELTSTAARAQAASPSPDPQTRGPGSARIARPSSGPFSPIQDPRRPPTAELQELSQEILQMGYRPDLNQLPQLIEYTSHAEPVIRCYAATALEQCARRHRDSDHLETILSVLEQLQKDGDREVQQITGRVLERLRSVV
jgi:hypothetical protein